MPNPPKFLKQAYAWRDKHYFYSSMIDGGIAAATTIGASICFALDPTGNPHRIYLAVGFMILGAAYSSIRRPLSSWVTRTKEDPGLTSVLILSKGLIEISASDCDRIGSKVKNAMTSRELTLRAKASSREWFNGERTFEKIVDAILAALRHETGVTDDTFFRLMVVEVRDNKLNEVVYSTPTSDTDIATIEELNSSVSGFTQCIQKGDARTWHNVRDAVSSGDLVDSTEFREYPNGSLFCYPMRCRALGEIVLALSFFVGEGSLLSKRSELRVKRLVSRAENDLIAQFLIKKLQETADSGDTVSVDLRP